MPPPPLFLGDQNPSLRYVVEFDDFLDEPEAALQAAREAAFEAPPRGRYVSHNAPAPEPLLREVCAKLNPIICGLLEVPKVRLRPHYRSKMARLFHAEPRRMACHADCVPLASGVGLRDFLLGEGLEADETNFAPGQHWSQMREGQFNWTFVVYLSDGPAEQGTGLWRHRPTCHHSAELPIRVYVNSSPADWELIHRVRMGFNRAVLLPSCQFHGPPQRLDAAFTQGLQTARLTLNPKLVSQV